MGNTAPLPPEIIQGLSVDVKAEEMSQHAKTRAKFHCAEAEVFEKSIKDIQEGTKNAEQMTRSVGKGGTRQPTDEIERAARFHRQRERFFSFAAEHFVSGAIYRLTTADMQNFEIYPATTGY